MCDSCTVAMTLLGCEASQEHEAHAILYVEVVWWESCRIELIQEFHLKSRGISRIICTVSIG